MCSGFGTVAIWGVGLIGGSIGMALRQRGLAGEVIGIGRAAAGGDAARAPGAGAPWATGAGAAGATSAGAAWSTGAGVVGVAGCGLAAAGAVAVDAARAGAAQAGTPGDAAAGIPEAVRLGAVDRMVADPAAALARADLVILAMPVQAMIDLAPHAAPLLRPGTIVTDVASVKAAVVAAWEAHLPDGVAFVGGHPMFGRERSGVAAASADLIPGCRWVLTPGERAGAPRGAQPVQTALERVRDLVVALGAEPVVMTPEEHDRRAAGASHLPQLVATALAAAALRLDEAQPGTLALAAGGFRDTTRIADSPAALWHEIWANNRPALEEAVAAFRGALADLEAAIAAGDAEALARLFDQAHAARRRAMGSMGGGCR
ncbi:prephenate dehydrogenase [Symbiobacterium terraclitae]|uniref:Prephenate dehydrogenase n=1 Tax=Symbiobacterium terraclitae TaxID=557451 RepID=A0ABS4JUP6_9FIRM|nr:prephenate dehydrogenase/arogenate dehydrogenase family protein [Symbiobacterium terraclitae]MBP2019289.1 prephenate dehydrogenase [Symbiobacterium terraclitae]